MEIFYNYLRINLRQKSGYPCICTIFVKPILYETWFIVVVNFTLFVEISRSASKIQIYLNVQQYPESSLSFFLSFCTKPGGETTKVTASD